MAYSKQTWSSNELITADKLNHIEDGIPTKTSQLTNDSGFLTSHQSIAGKKNTQSAVSSPSASGTAVAFIDSISQDTQGVITPTKKTVASASQSSAGLMSAADKTKLDTTIVSDSTARTISEGTSSAYSVTNLTTDHVVIAWRFSGGYSENNPPADITVTTANGSYSITVSNLAASGITMQPVFIKP